MLNADKIKQIEQKLRDDLSETFPAGSFDLFVDYIKAQFQTQSSNGVDFSSLTKKELVDKFKELEIDLENDLQTITNNGNITNTSIRLQDNKEDVLDLCFYNGKPTNFWGNIYFMNNGMFTYKDDETNSINIVFGYYPTSKLENSEYNTIIGYQALAGGALSVKSRFNVFLGNYIESKNAKQGFNTVIGNNINLFASNYQTIASDYYPILGQFFTTDPAKHNDHVWGPLYNTAEIHYVNALNTVGIRDAEGNISGVYCNTFIGNGIGPKWNEGCSFQSIWIGSNVRNSRFAYKFVGNIFMGNEIYAEHPHDRPAGAIIIGNYLRVSGRHTLGELAIHNSTHTYTHWNNALIRGNFNSRYLKINGKFQLDMRSNLDWNNNADGDDTFTKEVVARPDGTLGIRSRDNSQSKVRRYIKTEDLYINAEDISPSDVWVEDLHLKNIELKANKTYSIKFVVKNTANSREPLAGMSLGFKNSYSELFRISDELTILPSNYQYRVNYDAVVRLRNKGTTFREEIFTPNKDITFSIYWAFQQSDDDQFEVLKGSYIEVEELF